MSILATVGGVARAQPELDAGIALAENAEFEAALGAFERALASATLDRAGLTRLLSERALVYSALGREHELHRDLDALAIFAPDHDFGRRAPPALQESWDQVRAGQRPIGVSSQCEPREGIAHVRASLSAPADPALARVVIVSEESRDHWVRHETAQLDLRGTTPKAYYVEVVGLGEVVLANEGSKLAARSCAALPPPLTATADEEPPQRSRGKMWWWIGGTTGAAALATVAVLTLSRGRSDGTENEDGLTDVGRPTVSWP